MLQALDGATPSSITQTEHGIKYTYHVKLTGKNGNNANVTIVIQKDNGSDSWRVITIYPDKKDK